MRSRFFGFKKPFIALLTPLIHAYKNGHLRSSLTGMSVDRSGNELPWYSLPAVKFLSQRDYSNATILEFGGGFSTIWWSKRAKQVITFEESAEWINTFMIRSSPNVRPHLVPVGLKGEQLWSRIHQELSDIEPSKRKFDIVVIDAMHRESLVDLAFRLVTHDGLVIIDNSEGYNIQRLTGEKHVSRIDFIGPANGVSQQHATSIFFNGDNPYLSPKHPIAWD